DREERYQSAKDMLIDLRHLKRKLEVDAEIDRTQTPDARGPMSTVSGAQFTSVAREVTGTTSSAEYIFTGIKRHKLAAVIAVSVLALSVIGFAWYRYAVSTEVAIQSIAVLPFVNQGNDPNAEYLSDGLTEGIINSLTQLPNLRVVPRNSVFRYK